MKFSLAPNPGILQTFRRFIWVRLSLVLFLMLVYMVSTRATLRAHYPVLAFILLDVVLLLMYLSLPKLERALKGAYLPIGIAWSTLGPMIQVHLAFSFFAVDMPVRAALLLVLQPILVLFIPLIMVAWVYPYKVVLLFSGVTFLFDMILVITTGSVYGAVNISPIPGITFSRTILFLMIGYLITNMMKVQRDQQQRLLEANERLAQYAAALEQLTISRERNRMARELHDVLAHTMSGVAVELEGVRALLRVDPDQAETLLGQSLGAVRDGLSETRRALQSLRAAPLEDLGLGLAVRSLAESIAGRAGLQTELEIEGDLRDFPLEVQQCFYRVAQEALTNVVAHSQASNVQVCLKREGSLLKLVVQDDGVGFDEQNIDLEQKYGLLGIRERAEMIHAQLSIHSHVGEGTRLVLMFDTAESIEYESEPAQARAGGLDVEVQHG